MLKNKNLQYNGNNIKCLVKYELYYQAMCNFSIASLNEISFALFINETFRFTLLKILNDYRESYRP